MSASPTANAPSGVVTFLFTDIEGSTSRWEADADGMRAALAAHDEVLRSAIEAHGGWLFKHTGDGVCAAFASARSAVNAATAAQRALELPVRMGLATGEAELRGADYFGPVLNRAARVMAAGHGGQVLLAESTATLLSGVDLRDLGRRRLRDLPSPVGVFQLQAPGLRTDFPPLRTLDVNAGNLRPAVTSFVGREAEIAEVQTALRAHRLVTLTGVGGVGKTRLATEAAAQLSDEFPDGVWLFELAAVTDPAAVPDAVATELGVTQQPGMTMAESVAAAQEGRIRLMVFDNCEHLRDAAADLIETVLAGSPTVRVLTTSREGLGLADEQLWPVPSLDLGAGVDSAAVKLYVERAGNVSPHFSLTDASDADAVVEICRRLDGIPLAIELAASRMASMTLNEVRDRLDRRFRLLVGSRRGLERHQTLRHAVAWSYDQLGDAEKALLERCSVFAGGFDLQSACAITGLATATDVPDDFEVLDLLDALVRKSLLVADRSAGHTRFSMLETIRQFAEEQLVARGEATHVRNAHARYFAGRETDILALWDSPRQREAYEWFSTELANLRTAFRWAADNDDLDVAVAIATYSGLFGYLVENYEPVAWAEELIEPARAVHHPRLETLYGTAALCWTLGRVDEAIGYAEASLLARRGDAVSFGLDGLPGGVYVLTGQYERCFEWYRAYFEAGRDDRTLARDCQICALVLAGRHDEAMAAADGLIDAAEASGNPWEISYALLTHGLAFADADPVGALDALRRGWAIAQDSGIRCNESYLAGNLARLESLHGDQLAALDYIAVAIDNYRRSGNFPGMSYHLGILAAHLYRLGRHEPAATLAGHAAISLVVGAWPELGTATAGLREVLGDETYASLARKGETMSHAAIATYAGDQIDEARAELKRCAAGS
nr:adenylate/guanylate cyclase domain-containing protein [Mycobacterium sp. 852002-51163_SCH5372311]